LEINTGLRQRRAAAEERRGLTITADSGTKYRLGALVGAGGMGAVYRALTLSGKVVAVKRLHPHWFDSARQKKALLREALIVNSLEHQGVVRVIDHGGLDTESPYLVMELLEGKTLRQRAEQSGERLPWRDAAHIAERVLDVLAAAHARGIVHCDVKPSNIFLCDDGKAKLLDFGISRPPEELLDATLSVHIAGTPACMAPEQIFDPRGVDPRTDLWSLGATLFWSITGEWPRVLPEPCPSLAEAAKLPARSIRDLSPTLPEDLALTIDVALRLDRDARWPSARAMQAWLLRVLGSEVKEPLQPPPPLRAVADAPAEA
jgi:serine/threonine-protein kinase